MGSDVAIGDVRAELESDGHRRARGAARLLATERECAGVVKPACEDVGDGLREQLGAVELEKLSRARGHEADIAAGVDPSRVQRIDAGDLREQPVAHLRDTSRALLLQELVSMVRIFDALVLAPAAFVARDDRGAIEQTHLVIARDEGHGSTRVARRDRVEIRCEVNEGGRVDARRRDEIRLRQRCWQAEKTRLLFGEDLRDGAVAEARMRTRIRDVPDEVEELAIAIFDARDRACREEAVTTAAYSSATEADASSRNDDMASAANFMERVSVTIFVGILDACRRAR